MAKGGLPGVGKLGARAGSGKRGTPVLGTSQLKAGPGLSRSAVNTKGTARGTVKAARSLPQGRGGKAI